MERDVVDDVAVYKLGIVTLFISLNRVSGYQHKEI
jgi:hypothetical protein